MTLIKLKGKNSNNSLLHSIEIFLNNLLLKQNFSGLKSTTFQCLFYQVIRHNYDENRLSIVMVIQSDQKENREYLVETSVEKCSFILFTKLFMVIITFFSYITITYVVRPYYQTFE